MANNHSQFLQFEDKITINRSRVDSLRVSRNKLREKIKTYFKDKKSSETQPKFHGQGSFMSKTLINPIPRVIEENGEEKTLYKYDIDDGVYFICNDDDCTRKSINTYHSWIVDATDGHTNTKPIDKNTCVRIIFSDGHNIDLPIYFTEDENHELAHKSKGWLESDPKEFTKWVTDSFKTNYQIRRLIKYVKAWKDFREYSNQSLILPSGLIFTILVIRNYVSNDRDDIAFFETVKAIRNSLGISFTCYRPTKPTNEDLLAEYNNSEKILSELDSLVSKAETAINEDDSQESCKKWQSVFGDRFSCSNLSNQQNLESLKATAAVSKPWSATR